MNLKGIAQVDTQMNSYRKHARRWPS